jgi:hypothetical protein
MKWKIYLLAGFFLLLAGKSLQANNLLTEVKNPDLTESEQRYFDILITNKTTLRYKIVQADLSVLKGQSDVVNVSLFDNVKVSIVRFVDPLELPDHRIWKGNLSGSSEIGQAHFVVAQKNAGCPYYLWGPNLHCAGFVSPLPFVDRAQAWL